MNWVEMALGGEEKDLGCVIPLVAECRGFCRIPVLVTRVGGDLRRRPGGFLETVKAVRKKD